VEMKLWKCNTEGEDFHPCDTMKTRKERECYSRRVNESERLGRSVRHFISEVEEREIIVLGVSQVSPACPSGSTSKNLRH
jgi:hypothetical protein